VKTRFRLQTILKGVAIRYNRIVSTRLLSKFPGDWVVKAWPAKIDVSLRREACGPH
jgi:hypothetical protein